MQIYANLSDTSFNEALRIVEDAWSELQGCPYVQLRSGIAPTRLPEISFTEAERRSGVGSSLLKRLEALDHSALPHNHALTLRLVHFRAQIWSRAADWYWLAIDPLGMGSFGLFLPTAYCGGWLLNTVRSQLASFSFSETGDTDRYLALVADYARLIDQFVERTNGQAQRGIRIPKVQVKQARTLLAAFRSGARAAIEIAPQRFASISTGSFTHELESRIVNRIEPAFDRALEQLSKSYFDQAPDQVGMGQYPGGTELYAELVKQHTTLDLTPDQVHERGLQRMTEIEKSVRAIQGELGFGDDAEAFVAHLNKDPRWRADTVEGVAAVFQRYIDRLKPHLKKSFSILPGASYGVSVLPEALQGSMTYGYYDSPRRDRSEGFYVFNAANLTKQPLFHIGALTFHELMPGHHLHFATQQENKALHPFCQHSFVNAYIEGWAEYAATFAGEIGMYEVPEERYGRLVMDAFLTSRLVVDTGMNVLGWSLERARNYMRAHSRLSEAEILTETVRYSCDIPGQSLAYKLGDSKILGMREHMRRVLGARFDPKDFHAAILGPGALPMADLEWHVDHEIERLRERWVSGTR